MTYELEKLETAFKDAMNPKDAGIPRTLITRAKLGHHTFTHADNKGTIAVKVAGVGLGALMTAYGLDHSIEGMREEPRPNLSHEGVNIGHVLSGLFCAGIGASIAFNAYTKPLGPKSEALMKAVTEAAEGLAR